MISRQWPMAITTTYLQDVSWYVFHRGSLPLIAFMLNWASSVVTGLWGMWWVLYTPWLCRISVIHHHLSAAAVEANGSGKDVKLLLFTSRVATYRAVHANQTIGRQETLETFILLWEKHILCVKLLRSKEKSCESAYTFDKQEDFFILSVFLDYACLEICI